MEFRLKVELVKIAKKYDLSLLVFFGSRANGLFRNDSDWDIAFKSGKKLSVSTELKLHEEIETLFYPHKVDLINIIKINSLLIKNNILKGGACIFEKKKGIFDKEQMDTWFDFQDFKHYYEEEANLISERIKAI